jgi:endonuclease/exonuclease/phosphatase family metal-dependent hydrolase
MYAPARTAQLVAIDAAEAQLSCLEPVDGLTWVRWADNQQPLDLWCHSVGRPLFEARPSATADIVGMRILRWNVHVGAGRLEELLRLLEDASNAQMGLVVLLQETFRTGDAVPESYPATLQVPKAIRPRRPAMDVRDIADTFGLSVAYVPSMRNGPATSPLEREDRGNAILSTEPLTDVRIIELPFGKQRRVAISAIVLPRSTHPGVSPLRVVSTHLDTNGDRLTQSVALSERLADLSDLPMIVGGDLNSRAGFEDGAVRTLASRIPLAACGTGRTNRWPLRLDVLLPIGRLDFMFAGTSAESLVRSCETLPHAYDSDHLPLLMTLQY